MTCAFCRVIARETEAAIVFEDELSLAFLDVRPLFPGHTLLVPKAHYETLTDLPRALAGPFLERAPLLARAVETAMDAAGTFVAVNNRVSQSVPHLHVHIVPRRQRDGLRGFFWPRLRYDSPAQMAEVAGLVRAAAAALPPLQ